MNVVKQQKACEILNPERKKKMKKVVALLLIAVMAIGFVSCGKTAGGDVNTLVWYLPGEKQADTALVCEEINKIIEPKIGAKIDIQYIVSSDFTERLRLIMASQDEFDLCFTGFANPYVDGVRRGGFYELSDLLEKYGDELSKAIPDYLWEAVEVDGEIYAVPCYQAMALGTALYFNKDLVEKYNFDISTVKKYEDIKPFLEAVRDNEKGNVFPTDSIHASYFMPKGTPYQDTSINYVRIDKNTKKVVFEYDMPGWEEARKKAQEWRKLGFTNPDISAATSYQQAACWITTGYRPGDVADAERRYGFEIVAVPLSPHLSMTRSSATSTMVAISATSKNPEKAMQFIVEVNTNPDVFNLCAYGIKDKHYTMVTDKHIRINPEGGYNPGGNWKYGNMFIGHLIEGYEDDLWDQIKKANDESDKNVLLGFIADVTPVKTVISQLSTVVSEYKELQNGTTIDLEGKTKEFEEKLKTAGKDELMEYAQKVIDEYFAKKDAK